MRKIYIVLTYTGTLLSNFIKLYTQKDYSHVSLSFDEELEEMYSFGRLYTYNAFIGGFIKESLTSGTYKRFKNTETSVYEIEITAKQYIEIQKFVKAMYKRRKEYKFNLIGLFFVMFNKKIKRKNALYCAEFVKRALEEGNVDVSYLPEIIKPEDFKKMKNAKLIYKGKLRKYRTRMRKIEIPKPITIIHRRAAV
ncbi:MAG: hypothetical protein ACI4VN_02070 [Clostridia bacterium]|nr:hypothetical protein [Clostridia bacterium]